VLRRLRAGEPFSGMDYAHALRVLIQWKHQFKMVFQNVDMLLVPTTPVVAPKITNAETAEDTHNISRTRRTRLRRACRA